MSDDGIESLAAEFHRVYQAEAKRQGDVRHKDAYDDLAENIKNFDRALARHVLCFIALCEAEVRHDEAQQWLMSEGIHPKSRRFLWRRERVAELKRQRDALLKQRTP